MNILYENQPATKIQNFQPACAIKNLVVDRAIFCTDCKQRFCSTGVKGEVIFLPSALCIPRTAQQKLHC